MLDFGEYHFYLTQRGKEFYEKTLLPVHEKFLEDISCETVEKESLKYISHEDEFQVIEKVIDSES